MQMYSDASNQTINTGKDAKDFGLNILNTHRSFGMVFHSPDIVSVLFWHSLFMMCLLIEILIETSERDFNHRGVVLAYLPKPQRKMAFPADAVTPLMLSEMCLKTYLPFKLCNTCQTAATIAATEYKQNEEAI